MLVIPVLRLLLVNLFVILVHRTLQILVVIVLQKRYMNYGHVGFVHNNLNKIFEELSIDNSSKILFKLLISDSKNNKKINQVMLKKIIPIALLIINNFILSYGQEKSDHNFNFENLSLQDKMPAKWFRCSKSDYIITTDFKIKHNGKHSVLIQSKVEIADKVGCISTAIPATMSGDTITVKAFMKMEKVSAPIGLMLQVNGEGYKVLAFENMMQKGIKGSSDWKEYSVSVPLPENAETIFIGAILSGKGKLWVDDFSLCIDGKDFRDALPKEIKSIKVVKAKTDTIEFKESSNIIIDTLDVQQIKNLDKLGRIWGMMKYFHPVIAQGEYNWDYELFRILPAVINAQTDGLCNLTLINWVHQFGKFDLESQPQAITLPIKMKADFKWTENEELLSRSLVLFLDSLRNAEKVNEHYYIDFAERVGNPIFKNENAYTDMKYPDAGYRLLSLFRYWNMIQYFFPYKYLIGEDWNLILPEFILKFIQASSEIEYQTVVLELVTRINDTHAQVTGERPLALDISKGLNTLPFNVRFVEKHLIVAEPINNKLAKESILQRGDILLKINNKKIDELVSEQRNYTPASNEDVRLRDIANNLIRSQDTLLFIQYQRNGIVKADTVLYSHVSDIYKNREKKLKPSYNQLPSKVGYIYMETLKRDSVDFVMKKLKNTRGLIIDLRCYPSDFPLSELGVYLMPSSADFVKFTRTNLSDIGSFYFDNSNTVGKENKDYYKEKVVILVNELTQSSAEFHAMAFRTAPNATVLGSTTAAADGNVSYFLLPGGIHTLFTGIGIYYPDGSETQRIGIVPDVEIKPTIEGIRAGKDEVLEKAIELINQK